MSSFLVLGDGDTRNRWRDGQVCPDVDKELWRLGPDGSVCFGVLCANRTREVKRDFCDLPIRKDEGRVVNTPLVFKRVLFQERGRTKKSGRENGRKEEERRKRREREETERGKRGSGRERAEPALNGEKG
ncbi:hypothetical protein TNCV_491601 [Trichonephila clavipes]|nr:hypothetical protein TNCV_491601 [Trichonephila clavipes]